MPHEPPIKCHGKKTRLVPWIRTYLHLGKDATYYEPFMGSGAVGFSILADRKIPTSAAFSDINPHLIGFYEYLQKYGEVAPDMLRYYLKEGGGLLRRLGSDHYYDVRNRFNHGDGEDFPPACPVDFLFLNRSCFNGVLRFNSKGEFNTPFCKNTERFSPSYITKIVNQIKWVQGIFAYHSCSFLHIPFDAAIRRAGRGDVIYCDPPYLGRNTGYNGQWTEEHERVLHRALVRTKAKFVLSSWKGNAVQQNEHLALWKNFRIVKREYTYIVGPKVENRYPMTEVLVMNF